MGVVAGASTVGVSIFAENSVQCDAAAGTVQRDQHLYLVCYVGRDHIWLPDHHGLDGVRSSYFAFTLGRVPIQVF